LKREMDDRYIHNIYLNRSNLNIKRGHWLRK